MSVTVRTGLPTSTSIITTSTVPASANALATVATTSTAAASVETQLAAGVRGFFAARAAANAAPAPNPKDPLLVASATGDALADVRAETTKRRDVGQAIRAGSGHVAQTRVGFVSVTGPAATVVVCSIDDGVTFEVATGRVVSDAVMTRSDRFDLEQSSDVWKVARVVRIQQWEGVAGCARSPGDFSY